MRIAIVVALGLLAALVAPAEERVAAPTGREVYARLACWQCHVRSDEAGPASLPETRRAGPLLGGELPPRSRAWHLAHLYAPRTVSAGSQMPSYAAHFRPHPRAAEVRAFIETYDSADGGRDDDGIVARAEYERRGGEDWEGALARLDTGHEVISAADAPPLPSADLQALVDDLLTLPAGPAPAAEPPRELPPDDAAASLERGAHLYARLCAGCHGERADGNGPAAAFFGDHPPRNFLRGEYRFRSTPIPQPPSDADLFRTIRAGAGASMPAWPRLSDRQVWDLVAFLKSNHPDYLPREMFVEDRDGRTLCAFVRGTPERPAALADAAGAALEGGRLLKRAGRWSWFDGREDREIGDGLATDRYRFRAGVPVHTWPAGFEPQTLSIPEPPFAWSAASAEKGAEAYRELGCASCHGESGAGDGPAAAQTRGSLGQILLPADYTRGPGRLKGGDDARSLVRTFLTGLHGTPMPEFRDSLRRLASASAEDAPWHLAHFVLRQAGLAPPGR